VSDFYLLRRLHEPRPRDGLVDATLLLGFFISGCSALIYQVCWQRSLYSVIGVDMDSVTIVVSAFMLGIGTGGMLGGRLADRYAAQRIRIFAVAELSIALYGVATIWLLPWLDDALAAAAWGTPGARALLCFSFLILPTTLMGMTLPLLTMAFNERRSNIGISVGVLYFANTLGAALGAGLVPFVLLRNLTLSQSVLVAVAGNLVVVAAAVSVARALPSPKATLV
jgi:predicted membrane-bound spermidine synthase